VRRTAALGMVLLLTAGLLRAQGSRPPETFGVDLDVVSVTAVIHDKAGNAVRGLGPGDVELFEDGVPQTLSYFQEAGGPGAKIPLSVVMVLDTSGSMRSNLRFLREAGINFVRKLENVDTLMVVDFNETVRGSAEFTGDVDHLERFIEGLDAWGGTSLYDALHYALERVRDRPGRKAVVVFSDGADTTSSLRGKEVTEFARAVEATIYCIGISGEGGTPRGFLKRIAAESGGRFFQPGKVGDLLTVFGEISAELHSHYAMGYTPLRSPDGTWRRIELRVRRPNVDVRVRQGYLAVKRRRRQAGGTR
jgi:Ca-activated chloride channel family protein